jgi:hypothetical protein
VAAQKGGGESGRTKLKLVRELLEKGVEHLVPARNTNDQQRRNGTETK